MPVPTVLGAIEVLLFDVAILNNNLIFRDCISCNVFTFLHSRPIFWLNLTFSTTLQSDSLKLLPQVSFSIAWKTTMWLVRICLSQLPNLILKILNGCLDISQGGIDRIKFRINANHESCQHLFNREFPFFRG